MKYYIHCICIVVAIVLVNSCGGIVLEITIAPRSNVDIKKPPYAVVKADIENLSTQELQVKVVNPSGDFVQGFGLSANADATVIIAKTDILQLHNTSGEFINSTVSFSEGELVKAETKNETISFTLYNSSEKSIPLVIPDVMNPNLSPVSNSGVDLRVGQEIFFLVDGDEYLLLKVDENIKNNDTLNIPKLIQKRVQELGL
jgi:hypothetical protein